MAVAGPNGAGKSTLGPTLLERTCGAIAFLNADLLARGLSGAGQGVADFEAGRLMLRRLRQLARLDQDFAFETTLASRGHARWIRHDLLPHYRFHLFFLHLRDADLAVARVQERMRLGGHAVPEEVVRRRYYRGLANFFQVYRGLARTWRLYDNSEPGAPRLVAVGRGIAVTTAVDAALWDSLLRRHDR